MGAAPGDAANGIDAWLASLSGLIAELVDRWELELDDPLPGGALGYVVGATRAGTDPVVLKLTYPDGWFPERVAALLAWDGEGAIDLIDHDPRGAMLLERAVPGTPLAEEPDERALPIAAGVLQRLWIPAPDGITSAIDEVGRWVATFRDRNDALGRPLEPSGIDDAEHRMRELVASPVPPVLLHGDPRLGNVVAAKREPWLAISPHPLAGDRAFDVACLFLDLEHGAVDETTLQRRFELLTGSLACDAERLRAWSMTLATDAALAAWTRGDATDARRQLAVAERLPGLRA